LQNYCEQLAETFSTDCTRTRWPPDIDEDDEGVLDVPEVPDVLAPDDDDEDELDTVPVISTFSPTCLLSSLSWPSRM